MEPFEGPVLCLYCRAVIRDYKEGEVEYCDDCMEEINCPDDDTIL